MARTLAAAHGEENREEFRAAHVDALIPQERGAGVGGSDDDISLEAGKFGTAHIIRRAGPFEKRPADDEGVLAHADEVARLGVNLGKQFQGNIEQQSKK